MNGPEPRYMLATGEAAAQRLRLIDEIFGPATREAACGAKLALGIGA